MKIDSEWIIRESPNFLVVAEEKPLVDRNDGGHVVIYPKKRVVDRQELSPEQAVEFMRLTMVVGEAMITVLNRTGVDIGRINYQDNGNWGVFKADGPSFHLHLYGRAKGAKLQKYGQSLHFPHRDDYPELYENLKPLTKQDIAGMSLEIRILFQKRKYADEFW